MINRTMDLVRHAAVVAICPFWRFDFGVRKWGETRG